MKLLLLSVALVLAIIQVILAAEAARRSYRIRKALEKYESVNNFYKTLEQ
jgi:hypothetical protein